MKCGFSTRISLLISIFLQPAALYRNVKTSIVLFYSPVIISGYERLPAAQIAGSAWSVKTGLELEPYGYHTRICPAKTAGQ